jgi:hypothetical protein
MPITKFASNPGCAPELPAQGYPFSEQDLRDWFRLRYGFEASELELGALMDAMVMREDHPRPDEPRPEPGGWRVEPLAEPADER